MGRGIRVRITAIAMSVVTVVLVAAGLALLASQRRILTENLDEILSGNSRTIERAYEAGDLGDPIGEQGDEDAIAQVVDAGGHVVASTTNFAAEPALDPPDPDGTEFRTLRLPTDEGDYRLLSRSVDGAVIHTGTPSDDVDESVAALRTGLLVGIPAVAAAMGMLIWWLVGRTLRPVEEATRREQRFVADASHELRSPLTRMRTELEVDLAHPETANLVATHRSVLEEVGALHRLVEDLLHLARSGDGTAPPRNELVDVDDLVLDEARRLRAGSDVHVDTARVSAAQVAGDRDQLARAIRNLGDNAARHASSRIVLATGEADGIAVVSVADDGPGIPEHERSLVFERFARLDESRHAASGGTGLGLAIALDIVRRHGGTITVEDAPGGGARFVVRLPAADAAVS